MNSLPLGCAQYRSVIEYAVRILILKQDRDTRHACAESILTITTDDLVTLDAAHNACLNTLGGIK